MIEPIVSAEGLTVMHVFCSRTPRSNDYAVISAVQNAGNAGAQVVTVAVLGHKADLAFMVLHSDAWVLRDFQSDISHAGLDIVHSFVSITELSEYAQDLPAEMADMRLYPSLPPPRKPAWCFYPMSKRRNPGQNWYELAYEQRKELMHEHGASGRRFSGRVVQLITASTGLDDWEWGVTLFGRSLDDLTETVHKMRFDRASAVYADFGPFYTGLVGTLPEVLGRLARLGLAGTG